MSERALRIYVATSWRNEQQPAVVSLLRADGYEVYDFRNPPHGNTGFHWSDIGPDWQRWTPEEFRDNLDHVVAREGYQSDYEGMKWADVCVLLMPCGRSAHLEAGWFAGHPDKGLVLLLSDGEPELMYRMADRICVNAAEVLADLGEMDGEGR